MCVCVCECVCVCVCACVCVTVRGWRLPAESPHNIPELKDAWFTLFQAVAPCRTFIGNPDACPGAFGPESGRRRKRDAGGVETGTDVDVTADDEAAETAEKHKEGHQEFDVGGEWAGRGDDAKCRKDCGQGRGGGAVT